MKANVHLVLIFFHCDFLDGRDTVYEVCENTGHFRFRKMLSNTNFKNTSKIVQKQLSLLQSIYPEKILFQLINT